MNSEILIIGSELDYHAALVAWAIKKKGATPVYFDSSDYGNSNGLDIASFSTRDDNTHFHLPGNTIRSVYNRRSYTAIEDGIPTSKESRKFVKLERDTFNRWLFQSYNQLSGCNWVNGLEQNKLAENKILQLITAKSAGLSVPDTLVSGDAALVRQFVSENEGQTVYKPLTGQVWLRGGMPVLQTTTAPIQEQDLNDEGIALCAGIYQKSVRKESDVRVVIVGKELFAMKYSPTVESPSVDYRTYLNQNQVNCKSIRIPPAVRTSLLKLMELLELSYASADFAIDMNDQFVFLELNPGGQFGFVEDLLPDLKITNALANLLVFGDENVSTPAVSMNEFESSSEFPAFVDRHKQWPGSNVFVPDYAMSHIAK